MEDKDLNNVLNAERFCSLFKKGEQIYVGGFDWETSGYISKVSNRGFYLTQINNAKSLFYNWNQFEIIATAGYKITKETNPSAIKNCFNLRLQYENNKVIKNKRNLIYKQIAKKIFGNRYRSIISKISNDEFWKLAKNMEPYLYKLYHDAYGLAGESVELISFESSPVQSTGCLLNCSLHYKLDKFPVKLLNGKIILKGNLDWILEYLCSGFGDHYFWPNATNYHLIQNGFPITEMIERIYPYRYKGLYFAPYGYWGKEVNSENDMQKILDFSLKNPSDLNIVKMSTGDPYVVYGDIIGFKVWKSNDGFMMANAHSDTYFRFE